MLQIRDLHFAYGRTRVLDGVDATVPTGTFRGILGANGCGKSTLLKCLIGYLRPSSGSIVVDGHDLRSLRSSRRAELMGYVSQAGAASSAGRGLTVYDTVALGVPRSRRRDTEAIVRGCCGQLDVGGLLGRPLRELSGGQAQRVQLARALAQGAGTILLDEPVSNLDLRFQVQVMALLRRLAREQGTTVVAIVHDLDLALHYCDDVMVLHDGRTAVEGPAALVDAALIERVYGVPVDVVVSRGRRHVVPHDLTPPREDSR